MTAKILDGKAIAQELRESIRAEVDAQVAKGQNPPGLAVILVGEDPASQVYVRNKKIACEKAGFNDVSMVLPADTTEEQLLAEIDTLNARDDVHGIIVQLPVPDHIDPEKIIERIDPKKDVDGFHAYNMGRLATRMPGLAPCTPHGVMTMLEKPAFRCAGWTPLWWGVQYRGGADGIGTVECPCYGHGLSQCHQRFGAESVRSRFGGRGRWNSEHGERRVD